MIWCVIHNAVRAPTDMGGDHLRPFPFTANIRRRREARQPPQSLGAIKRPAHYPRQGMRGLGLVLLGLGSKVTRQRDALFGEVQSTDQMQDSTYDTKPVHR